MGRGAALIVVIALAFFTSISGHAQQRQQQKRLYRWVDDAGVVHYGDSVPPEYAGSDRDVLNKQGVTVGFEEGVVTPEEQAEKDRKAAAEEAERQAKVDAARRDQVLLDTYLSVSEIEALRDRRLELLESQIKVTEQYLANLRKRLGTLKDEAKVYKPENTDPDAPELPDNLKLDISRTTASISLYEQTLTVTRNEQEQLKVAFAEDIDRFKQLKGI
jgi:Domain of unknown function (DUF4124)